jgi:hypothetical protein
MMASVNKDKQCNIVKPFNWANLETDYNLGITSMRSYPLIFIVNTPMYDTNYRLKHGLKTKKILLPYDLFVTKEQYLTDVNKKTTCDFEDESEYEEVEILYECNSFTNDELIQILKRWWWYHNFYNLGTIKSEIKQLNDSGVAISQQMAMFFELIDSGKMPVISKILNIYENAVREIYYPESVSKIKNINSVHFFQKGMRTYEPAYFIDNMSAVKSELEQIYTRVNTVGWNDRFAVMLDNTI